VEAALRMLADVPLSRRAQQQQASVHSKRASF